ncbi:hypothetical protein [Thiobacter aerophilum]|uniref:Prophage protein n=1 Tax=Thiobacter aerophilum TaxID=3121275 RepID=A0ABV0EGM2_9BURK
MTRSPIEQAIADAKRELEKAALSVLTEAPLLLEDRARLVLRMVQVIILCATQLDELGELEGDKQ